MRIWALVFDLGATFLQVWDAVELARSPKPYFAIQLCCYSEMFAASTAEPLPAKFGMILGTGDRVALNVEDFIYYYRHVRRRKFSCVAGSLHRKAG